jgi:NADH dehydrogenase [ubiquinone] 1 alpha subcomplex assembly factor 5
VADVEDITLLYGDRLALLRDLRAAGETNAVALRDRRIPPRDLFAVALASLPEQEGRVPVALRLAMMTGWAPSPTQQQPLKPGSATASLADALRRS